MLAFGASFFARGFLAGSRRFTLYALLLLAESTARVSFALAVAVGIASGQTAVALGIVAAPLLSLTVVPLAFAAAPWPGAAPRRRRRRAASAGAGIESPEFTLAAGGGFAAAVLVIMFSEQTLLNAGPLLVRASEGAAAAGFIFNVLMIARAPLRPLPGGRDQPAPPPDAAALQRRRGRCGGLPALGPADDRRDLPPSRRRSG